MTRYAGVIALFGAGLLSGCSLCGDAAPAASSRTAPNAAVFWAGAQHKAVHDGDTAAKVRLDALAARPHLYAIGPLAGLRGEIVVLDGRPTIATVEEGGYRTCTDMDQGAAFLVWAYVPEWTGRVLPDSVRTLEDLAAYLPVAARGAGLDPEQPFAFRIDVRARTLAFHVLRPPEGKPTVETHEKSKVHGNVTDATVHLLGFYSTSHHGIFTPANSDLHVHFVTADGRLAGHVEDFVLAPGASLLFPSKGE